MKRTSLAAIRSLALFSTAAIAMLPAHAMAQTDDEKTAAASDEEAKKDDIVVTGTLIRGTQVAGSQTITVDEKQITAQAATSTNELLGMIPQITNTFNGRFEGDPRGIGAGISITKPNLRNFPGNNSTSGGLTLVLVDGLRIAPVGILQSSIDVDVIPAAVLQGVDAVTDGGSSLYGADAVAGVLNFRTMRKFEGIKVDGNFGFGTTVKGYHTMDGAITAGHSWTGGNAYISAGHSDRDGIINNQVPWTSGLTYNALGVAKYTYTQCPSPVGTETRWFRFGPGAAQFTNNPLAPGAGTFPVGTACDQTGLQTYVPQQKRSNVFGSISQEFGDNIDLRVTGYWTKRDTALANFPAGFTSAGSALNSGALVGAAFPGAAVGSITVVPGGTGFAFSPNTAYVNRDSTIGFQTWGVTPELTIKFGGDWQLKTSAHFGRSTNFQRFPGVNGVKAQCYITGVDPSGSAANCGGITGGQLNPLNVAAASAAVINDITLYDGAQDTNQQLAILRTVADGPLFALPGGEARVAVGAEYQINTADSRLNEGVIGSLASRPFQHYNRNAKSVFGEIALPIATFADVTGSVRYDKYSDFASSTSPNVGLTLKPTDWLKVFGHWNSSFNAPTAVDGLVIAKGRFACGIYVVNGTAAQRPNDPLSRDTSKQGTCALILEGSGPNLQPQTAKSWAVGFDAAPGSGIRFGGEFYSIDAKNLLGQLDPSQTSTYTTNPSLYTYNLTAAQYAALTASLTNGTAMLGQQPLASNIAIVVDRRTSNLNAAKLEGFDFHAYLDADTQSGHHISVGFNGTKATKVALVNNLVAVNQLGIGGPKLTVSTFMGMSKGPFSTRLTINYTGQFADQAINNVGVFATVNPFIVGNLSAGYDFKETGGALSGLSLRFNIDNLWETKPQTVKRVNTNNPSFNNWTLGRVMKLGASFKY
jgi:iron complex outermembrane recepter protein